MDFHESSAFNARIANRIVHAFLILGRANLQMIKRAFSSHSSLEEQNGRTLIYLMMRSYISIK